VGYATSYQRIPREFGEWLTANTVFGSMLAIGVLAMALAGVYPADRPDAPMELSSVTRSFAIATTAETESTTAEVESIKNLQVQKFHDMSLVFPGMIDLAPVSFQQLDL
jgi:hypothetical protein